MRYICMYICVYMCMYMSYSFLFFSCENCHNLIPNRPDLHCSSTKKGVWGKYLYSPQSLCSVLLIIAPLVLFSFLQEIKLHKDLSSDYSTTVGKVGNTRLCRIGRLYCICVMS